MACLSCSVPPEKEKSEDRAIPFDFPDLKAPEFPDKIFPIVDFGAVANDTSRMNTDAINGAIDACHKAGGGKVLIPSGIWLTGAIHLKSNINLHLEKGAELRFSQRFEDYLPVVLVQRGGIFCYTYSPFIYANKCENIAVTGEGTLNGRGQVWWPWKNKQPGMIRLFEMGKKGIPVEKRVFGTVEDGVRPPFMQFLECKNILVEDVTLKDGPSWNLHPVFCSNMIIRGVKVIAHGPNNDGIDPDGCRNVLIENCFVDVGDDNICLKSGRDEEARRIGRPCENIVIRRCIAKAGHGGFVIGSEMSAGVKNVLVEDCRFFGTDRGLRFKSRIGRGGIVENIWVRNIAIESVRNQAIDFNLQYDGEPIERDMKYGEKQQDIANAPLFRNIHFENITCQRSKTAINILGLPGDYLKDIYFKNIQINSKLGIISSNVNDIHFDHVSCSSDSGQ
jgi:polygalacturonase